MSGNKVTNLNIFAPALLSEQTIAMTKPGGDNCGKRGNYLKWEDMQWTLHGQATKEDVVIEEPCKVDPTTYVYYAEFARWIDCMRHCQDTGGRIPKIVTLEEWKKVNNFLKEFYASASYKLGGYWLLIG